jgi:hypothetical protein
MQEKQILKAISALEKRVVDLYHKVRTAVGAQGPQGVQGPLGPPGPVGPAGLNWQGAWVSGTSYVADDAVGFGGASYFCILATSGTSNPSVDTTHWALLASQGAIGPTGVQGPTGPQGPSGGILPYKSLVSYIQFTSDGTPLNTEIFNDLETGISFIQNSTGVYIMTSFLSSFTIKTVINPFDKSPSNPALVRLPIFNNSTGLIAGYYTIQRYNDNNVRMYFWDTSNTPINPYTLLGTRNILSDIKVYN